jgi:hypothetical protein
LRQAREEETTGEGLFREKKNIGILAFIDAMESIHYRFPIPAPPFYM